MADVQLKEAVANAMEFAKAVLEPSRTKDLRLEEVEWGEMNGIPAWQITLSMTRPRASEGEAINPMSLGVLSLGPRDYKTFMVRKDNGQVISMRILELQQIE